MVERRSSLLLISTGSTLESCKRVIPQQITRKPRTAERMSATDALKPWSEGSKSSARSEIALSGRSAQRITLVINVAPVNKT